MRVVERQFSDFLRRPNEVVAELEEHDVVLRRRGAPALRLTQVDREDARAETVLAVARMLRNLAAHSQPALESALEEGFPWAIYLPTAERAAFTSEVTRALVASADLRDFAPVAQLLREWRSTAEVHANPALAARLRKPIEADGDPIAFPFEDEE
jgi:hypothetical protein